MSTDNRYKNGKLKTEEELKATKLKMSDSKRKYLAGLTPEERKEWTSRMKESWLKTEAGHEHNRRIASLGGKAQQGQAAATNTGKHMFTDEEITVCRFTRPNGFRYGITKVTSAQQQSQRDIQN